VSEEQATSPDDKVGTATGEELPPELQAPPEEVVAVLAEDMHVATGTREPILQSSGVSMVFGGLRALNDVTFSLGEGEIIGLIGPNGAGKTTFFNCLTGLYSPTSGQVTLRGKAMPKDPARVTQAGVARTFQNIRLFPSMTAMENVLVGRHVRMKQGPLSSLLHGPRFRKSEAEAHDRAEKLLAFVGLGRFSDELARNLPYGDQRRLEIARALATDPSVLLLDEPTAGMNAQETEATRQLIFAIRDLGVSVVVIEHDTKFIFTLCDRVLVLVQGELLVEGSPDEVRGDPRVVEAYLGAPPEEIEAQIHAGATTGSGTGGSGLQEGSTG
jgi:branched-chain amino acid transport system ATP-binding protein